MAQVVVYGPNGARTTANTTKREGESMSEYERLIRGMIPGREGYAGATQSEPLTANYAGDYGGEDASTPVGERESVVGIGNTGYDTKDYSNQGLPVDESQSTFVGNNNPSSNNTANSLANSVNLEYQEGLEKANALYSFLPPSLLETFAQSWAKYGDANIAMGAVRKSNTWKQEFGYLQRNDGTLIMSEIDALATIATYKSTLAEVGITDFVPFEKQFENLIGNEVSGLEFQQRIDTVYEGVSNQIPEVEKLFRDRFNISLDAPTIFGALINPDIQDKVLAGDIATLQLQAQASSRGFSTTFSRFDQLRREGLKVQEAASLYESAQDIMSSARGVGRNLDLSSLEDAAIGDIESRKEIARAADELQSESSFVTGSRRKGDRVIGLTQR